jgi:hypothetical protein
MVWFAAALCGGVAVGFTSMLDDSIDRKADAKPAAAAKP